MRQESYVTGTAGRDKGRVYKLTEMPASQAEWWAARAMLGMSKGNADLGAVDIALATADGMEGFALLATTGLRSLMSMPPEDAQPLFAEMMACVEFAPTGATGPTVPLIEEHIEEVATRLQLRDEVIKLHTGFSLAERFQTWGVSAKRTIETMRATAASAGPSEPSSAPDVPASES